MADHDGVGTQELADGFSDGGKGHRGVLDVDWVNTGEAEKIRKKTEARFTRCQRSKRTRCEEQTKRRGGMRKRADRVERTECWYRYGSRDPKDGSDSISKRSSGASQGDKGKEMQSSSALQDRSRVNSDELVKDGSAVLVDERHSSERHPSCRILPLGGASRNMCFIHQHRLVATRPACCLPPPFFSSSFSHPSLITTED
jgi:hypothetical protein